MEKEINKTRFKVLFNNLLLESEYLIKAKVFYKNGLMFKIIPTENTQLNRYLLKI